MLTPPLPERVDPHLLAEENVVLQGEVPLSRFTRLTDYLCDRKGVVRLKLQFHQGKDGTVSMVGKVQTTLAMQCQYCLDRVDVAVSAQLNLVFVDSDESASALDETADAVLPPGDSIELVAIFEDDLILSLPMVAKHGSGDCIGKLEYNQDAEASNSPFVKLKRLMQNVGDA